MENEKQPLPQCTLGEGEIRGTEIEVIKFSKEVVESFESRKQFLILEDKDGNFWTLPKREKS